MQGGDGQEEPTGADHVTFDIPRLWEMARHAAPNILEGTVMPVAIFLLGLHLLGVWGAIALGLVWVYGAIGLRLLRGRRVPGLLLLGALALTARSVVAVASGSVFLYLLQPSMGTTLVALAFLASVPAGRPLAERLARDFVPLPSWVLADDVVRRFFVRVSLLWGFTQLLNAAISILLLLSQSIAVFMVARTLASMALTGTAVVVSTLWFRRLVTAGGEGRLAGAGS